MSYLPYIILVVIYLLTIPYAIAVVGIESVYADWSYALIAVFWPIAICLSFLYGIFHKETNHND